MAAAMLGFAQRWTCKLPLLIVDAMLSGVFIKF
jgi:hypothetical protein